MRKYQSLRLLFIVCIIVCLCGCSVGSLSVGGGQSNAEKQGESSAQITKKSHGEYTGEPFGILHDNQPEFTEEEKKNTDAFENYSKLDGLGRCGVAYANICKELMPTEKRGEIGKVKPSGWHTVKYDVVDGKYLYNRCHLIGYQLAGENANEKNLITGTRYLNVEGMLPFEDQVAEYVKESNHHVLYRVTPVYEGDNPVAEGVQMEAYSVEDKGTGVCFNVFVYNVQPGVSIDYATGESYLTDEGESSVASTDGGDKQDYIVNKNTGKFHESDCSSVKDIKPKNKKNFYGTREELKKQGYEPCSRCKP